MEGRGQRVRGGGGIKGRREENEVRRRGSTVREDPHKRKPQTRARNNSNNNLKAIIYSPPALHTVSSLFGWLQLTDRARPLLLHGIMRHLNDQHEIDSKNP